MDHPAAVTLALLTTTLLPCCCLCILLVPMITSSLLPFLLQQAPHVSYPEGLMRALQHHTAAIAYKALALWHRLLYGSGSRSKQLLQLLQLLLFRVGEQELQVLQVLQLLFCAELLLMLLLVCDPRGRVRPGRLLPVLLLEVAVQRRQTADNWCDGGGPWGARQCCC